MVDNNNKNHLSDATTNNYTFLDQFCRFVYEDRIMEAEKLLIEFLESTINHANGRMSLEGKKDLIKQIYFDFNKIYTNWLNSHKLSKKKSELIKNSPNHFNQFISHSSKYEEMDDLLYALMEYDNSKSQKEEMKYNLDCYKKQLTS